MEIYGYGWLLIELYVPDEGLEGIMMISHQVC